MAGFGFANLARGLGTMRQLDLESEQRRRAQAMEDLAMEQSREGARRASRDEQRQIRRDVEAESERGVERRIRPLQIRLQGIEAQDRDLSDLLAQAVKANNQEQITQLGDRLDAVRSERDRVLGEMEGVYAPPDVVPPSAPGPQTSVRTPQAPTGTPPVATPGSTAAVYGARAALEATQPLDDLMTNYRQALARVGNKPAEAAAVMSFYADEMQAAIRRLNPNDTAAQQRLNEQYRPQITNPAQAIIRLTNEESIWPSIEEAIYELKNPNIPDDRLATLVNDKMRSLVDAVGLFAADPNSRMPTGAELADIRSRLLERAKAARTAAQQMEQDETARRRAEIAAESAARAEGRVSVVGLPGRRGTTGGGTTPGGTYPERVAAEKRKRRPPPNSPDAAFAARLRRQIVERGGYRNIDLEDPAIKSFLNNYPGLAAEFSFLDPADLDENVGGSPEQVREKVRMYVQDALERSVPPKELMAGLTDLANRARANGNSLLRNSIAEVVGSYGSDVWGMGGE